MKPNNPFARTIIPFAVVLLFCNEYLSAQDTKCPPLIIPSVTYQYQNHLQSGVGAELNFWFVPSSCDCSGPFGALCYFVGPTAAFKPQYYPSAKTFDLAGSFGYRIFLFKGDVTVGYSFMDEKYGKSFVHIDPALGLDLALANLSVGYSFRGEEIDGKSGSLFVRLAVSPLIFARESRSRKSLSTFFKTSKADRKAFRASRR